MTEMTYNEAIEWMDSRHWSGTGKGIVRSQELLERLGNPQDKLKFVHVAGTNGKGSGVPVENSDGSRLSGWTVCFSPFKTL